MRLFPFSLSLFVCFERIGVSFLPAETRFMPSSGQYSPQGLSSLLPPTLLDQKLCSVWPCKPMLTSTKCNCKGKKNETFLMTNIPQTENFFLKLIDFTQALISTIFLKIRVFLCRLWLALNPSHLKTKYMHWASIFWIRIWPSGFVFRSPWGGERTRHLNRLRMGQGG